MNRSAPIEQWGSDHWSTFAYVETLCVDAANETGEIARDRMRTDRERHPLLEGHRNRNFGNEKKYPTRLKEGEIADHDDWDCLQDCEDAGLLVVLTLTSGYVYLTDLGKQVAGELRAHKASGLKYDAFNPSKRLLAQMEAARVGAGVR